MQFDAHATDVSVPIRALDTLGNPVEDKVASDFTVWYRVGVSGLKTELTLADLSSIQAAHVEGGIIYVADGWYRLDLPDALFVTGPKSIRLGGTIAGGSLYTPDIFLKTPVYVAGT